MNAEAKPNFKKHIANFFGAIGYLVCSLQWLWMIMLYFSLIKALMLLISPSADSPVVKPSPATVDLSSNTPLMIVAAIIVIIMVVLTIYIIVKMPSIIAKTGKKIVHTTANSATPIVLHIQHKKDTTRNHKKLTLRLILAIKIILITVPIILAFTSQFIEKQMIDFSIAIYVSLFLACSSIISFAIQYFLARLLSVSRQDLW